MDHHPIDDPLIDYDLYRFGESRQFFRGPRPDLRESYLCFLGAAHTFGRFTGAPFPSLIGGALGTAVLNLGARGAGPEFFLNDAELLRAATGARVCVVQAMCATAISNRMFGVRVRRNGRLDTVSGLLRGIFPDVDFDRFAFVRPMLRHLRSRDPTRFRLVENEMKTAWVGRMQALVHAVEVPAVLLWLAGRAPEDAGFDDADPDGAVPLFVDRTMVDAVRAAADGYTEVVIGNGRRQPRRGRSRPDLRAPSGERIERRRTAPPPGMHGAVAAALMPEVQRLLRLRDGLRGAARDGTPATAGDLYAAGSVR